MMMTMTHGRSLLFAHPSNVHIDSHSVCGARRLFGSARLVDHDGLVG